MQLSRLMVHSSMSKLGHVAAVVHVHNTASHGHVQQQRRAPEESPLLQPETQLIGDDPTRHL